MRRLSDELRDWRDPDGAAFALAVTLGLMDASTNFPTDAKHVFWSDNELGRALQGILTTLVKVGALEYSDEQGQYRWNRQFSWAAASARRGQ